MGWTKRSPLHLEPEAVAVIVEAHGCVVGVSGGADSTALLAALVEWSNGLNPVPQLHVAHVNHGLRAQESDADAAFVESLAERHRLPFHLETAPPLLQKPAGVSPEEYLRQHRYDCFERVLRQTGCRVLALAHTADDLAETFLLHLVRGSGLRGLSFAAVNRQNRMTIVRPLWKQSRSQVLAALEYYGLQFRHDSSNDSPEFTRNRVRSVLLPLLEREFNPAIRTALLRSAELLSMANEFIQPLAAEQLQTLQRQSGRPDTLRTSGLQRLDAFLQQEVLTLWIRGRFADSIRPSHDQITRILKIVSAGHGIAQLGGNAVVTVASGEMLLFQGEMAAMRRELAMRRLHADPEHCLAILPAPVLLQTSDHRVYNATVELLDGSRLSVQAVVDRNQAPGYPQVLVIRNRCAGDRLLGGGKLKDALIDAHVSWYLRDYLLVIASPGGRILHILGMVLLNRSLKTAEFPAGALSVQLRRESVKSP